MIYRKIIKVKTRGDRATATLAPDLPTPLPKGFNYVVHEYNEKENYAVVELWCCDHPALHPSEQKTKRDLEDFCKVYTILPTHPRSPKVIATLTTFRHDSVDEERKTIVVNGREGSYKRKVREVLEGGIEVDLYVLDEG